MVFFGFFQNPKTVLESEQAHLGGSKKRKKSIWPLLLPLKRHFLDFSNFRCKSGLFGLFLFFKIQKLFWNQNRHIWGGQRKEKNRFDHSFCLFLVSEDPAQKLKNRRKLRLKNRFLDPFQKSKINFKGIFGIYMA